MVNYLAIVVAALAQQIIGAVWYSPKVSGKMMETAMGSKKMDKSKSTRSHVIGALASLVMAAVLSSFIDLIGGATAANGVMTGFLVWLGFIATVTLGIYLWENKPFKLYLFKSAYWLVSLIAMGAILGAWV